MPKPWSDKERQYLKDNYAKLGATKIGEVLKRSTSSVYSQVKYLRDRGWTFK